MRKKIKINEISNKIRKFLNGVNEIINNKNNPEKEHSDERAILKLKDHYSNKDILNKNKKYFFNEEENKPNFRNKEDYLLLNKNIFSKKNNETNSNKKEKSLNIAKENKTLLGGAIFTFIVIVLIFSAYFFFIYSPFSEELRTAKIEKLNELNSLYKGPLAVNNESMALKSEINNAKSPEEVKLIDILQPATNSWREYHNHQISSIKDDYGRVMIKYLNNDSKNILLSVVDAKSFVNTNDATILSKINFIKPDTIIVPVSLSRLQAGGGLVSVGNFVDIYFTSTEDYNSNSKNTASTTKNESTENNNLYTNNKETSENKMSDSNSNFQYSSYNSPFLSNSNVPSIFGAVVVAIMRSKGSGVIDGNYLKSEKFINDNLTNMVENQESFSTDVEETLKSVAAGGFNEEIISKFLDSFGLKLSDYERVANIAELDSQYLILLEIPRNDVHLIINNMDNMRITIPTNKAPNWAINELKNKY
ncbi:MAG: DUF515 domain-containing protein [Methanobrevibacter sp.]|jgi:hypothetical protein|nr:DUF515 domain-containing protein [Candidatus Methanovirga procula]